MLRSFIKHWCNSLLFVASLVMIAWGSIQLGEYVAVVSQSENADRVTLAISMAIVVLIGTIGWAYNGAKFDTEINRVNCNNQAIDKNINKIRKKPFSSSLKI